MSAIEKRAARLSGHLSPRPAGAGADVAAPVEEWAVADLKIWPATEINVEIKIDVENNDVNINAVQNHHFNCRFRDSHAYISRYHGSRDKIGKSAIRKNPAVKATLEHATGDKN